MNLLSFLRPKKPDQSPPEPRRKGSEEETIVPGRVSVPDDAVGSSVITYLKGVTKFVSPSFRREIIPLLRDLYKVNPDVGIALQDMFKLANTGHQITFPNNTDEEAEKMRDHLAKRHLEWSRYSAGVNGLVNRMIVQSFVGGAISVEAVPNENLDGLSTILFLKPERIIFKRENNGVYSPYQINNFLTGEDQRQYIRLNPETYFYCGTFNDTDEPYGIPPFMPSLDSIKTQSDMRANMKNIMEIAGMVGFLEALVEKPMIKGNESEKAYSSRLNRYLREMKKSIMGGMKDGVVVGFKDDHEFKLNSTTKDLGNLTGPWNINQQHVANGLGVNGSIIGVNQATGEGATGTMLSKMISQLKNIQMMVSFVLIKIYSLELRLAGFNNKGMTITWRPSTVTDDVKIQQARQYQIQNNNLLYKAGIISQHQYAWDMGYDTPDQAEPRVSLEDQAGVNKDPVTGTDKDKRQADKSKSDRKGRDKNNPNPRRKDADSKPR